MTLSGHIAHCHALLDQNPQDWDTRLRLADLLIELGDEDGAACQRWIVEVKVRFILMPFGKWSITPLQMTMSPDHVETIYFQHSQRYEAETTAWGIKKSYKAKIRIEGP